MTQFGASLRFVDLAAVMELLASLASTGRLRVSDGAWTGEIVLRRGQIVAAYLGDETGRAALESIAIGILDGELNFVDEIVAEDVGVLLSPEHRAEYLQRLGAVRSRLSQLIPSLAVTPRLVESSSGEGSDPEVTVGAAALQLIPALASGHTLDQLARQHGLARTVRATAMLLEAGLIRLEAPTSPAPIQPTVLDAAPAPAQTSPAAVSAAPTSAPQAPARAPRARVMPPRPAAPRAAMPGQPQPVRPLRPSPAPHQTVAARQTPLPRPAAHRPSIQPRPTSPTPGEAQTLSAADQRFSGLRVAFKRLFGARAEPAPLSVEPGPWRGTTAPPRRRRDTETYQLLPG